MRKRGTALSNIMDIIAKETNGKSYKTFKYTYEGSDVLSFAYDDHQEITWERYGETVPPNGSINLKRKADSIANDKPLFGFFLDGSRHTYKVDDIAYKNKVYPVIAGQVGVSCCQRIDKVMHSYEFDRRLAIALPKVASQSDWNKKVFFANLCKKLNEESYLETIGIQFTDVIPYATKVDEFDRIEGKGIAVIQDLMIQREVAMVTKLVAEHKINNRRYLLKDGSLEYRVDHLRNDREKRQFQKNFSFVVGVSKSFNPENCKDKKGKNATYALYEKLHMSTEPFKNVQYYYPYAENKIGNTYLHREAYDNQRSQGKAHLYKYSYEEDKDNLDLMFASMDDPQQTMDSILNYIISNQGSFGGLDGWDDFLDEVQKYCKAGSGGDKEITVNSWRKFNRIIRKSIYRNEIFDSVRDNGEEVRIGEALKHIKKDEVHVIDIAKLNEDMQGFVFGDAIRAIYDLQLGQFSEDKDVNPPKKIVIFIDELNKYASTDTPKSSPILRQILDIAERGRSLGIILFSAEQFRSAIHNRVTGNCSTHAYGRTNAIEIAKPDYKFVPPVYKNMMTRLKQGEYIVQNPVFRSLLNIKFPKPIYKQYKQ